MKLVSCSINSYKTTGERIMNVVLASDNTPSVLPTRGAGIEGLNSSDYFAPLSVLMVVSSGDVYLTNESGTFVKQ